ncbi:RNA polymerase ECF-subfamily sigma factor [[Actinomadura] parvosata subsp. kistnae]|uniref:RNA polymerase sigma factor n=1 Tax=[Actinomadura] parvosata TaxID=1955412 RepID=UPI000D27D117|nr:RNA polymerase ECF-subfamily sigma factor [Actinomadura parvosata subsp. kistnae]
MATPSDHPDAPDGQVDWEDIFATHFAGIHRYIAGRLSKDIADDLAAEVFLAAYRQGYDPLRGAVRPWLYGIATHLVARHYRSETRKWKALSRSVERLEHDHEDTTLARVAANALAGRLAEALAKLSRRDRDVVLLHALSNLTHAEVSAALNIPVGTVASRLSRARKQLRGTLGDTNPLEGDHG